jgi:hypothetical protein
MRSSICIDTFGDNHDGKCRFCSGCFKTLPCPRQHPPCQTLTAAQTLRLCHGVIYGSGHNWEQVRPQHRLLLRDIRRESIPMDALLFYPTMKSMKFFARKKGPVPLTKEQILLCYVIQLQRLQASCSCVPQKNCCPGQHNCSLSMMTRSCTEHSPTCDTKRQEFYTTSKTQ